MAFRANVPSSSPEWIKPSDVLRLRKKLKPANNAPITVLKIVDQNVIANRTREAVFNPFRKETQKKKVELSEDNVICDDESSNRIETRQKNSILSDFLDDNANSGYTNNKRIEKVDLTGVQRCSTLPVDWSLKTKMRFISTKSFPWKGCLKTSEESSGTTSFVRCLYSAKYQECTLDTSANARFHQQCLVWMHPSLPWLTLFPRLSVPQNSSSMFSNNVELQDSLHSSWCDSFRSLYQLIRARQCPYFYLCAETFTAVFRASGVAGLSDHHVLLTPTTRGFRQSLSEEGIKFTMPLYEDGEILCNGEDLHGCSQDSSSGKPCSPCFEEDVECKENFEDEEPVTWLESLGLSQNDFPSLNPKRRKTEQENVDHRLQSLICIEGADTQAVVNFLLNSRSCTANTGKMAGVPPTLLAPCAFHGATLHPLKVRQARVNREQNCIEVTGPILPNILDGLCNLFNGTQDSQFIAMTKTLATTEGFSLLHQKNEACIPSAFAKENLKDSGLAPAFLQQVCNVPSPKQRPFCEITANSGLFSWK